MDAIPRLNLYFAYIKFSIQLKSFMVDKKVFVYILHSDEVGKIKFELAILCLFKIKCI